MLTRVEIENIFRNKALINEDLFCIISISNKDIKIEIRKLLYNILKL